MRAVSFQQPQQTPEDHLLALIPEDGRAIGNTELRRRLGWDEADYWSVRNGLIDDGVLEKGRGKGGSVRRVVSPAGELPPSAAGEVVAEVAEERARLYEQEAALYEPMRAVIETDWAKDRRVDPIAVEITAAQGRRSTGGRWTRPDIVSVSVQAFVHLPAGRFIEVTTFEVKPTDDIDVLAVYEALAHRRAATHSYVLLHVPAEQPALQEHINEICEVARFHGIGVIVADDPSNYETWEERETASRVEPDPARLDRFIATQLQGATKIAQAVR